MGKNSGQGYRIGPINNRTQAFNPKTGTYIKRDESGKFMSTKTTPFKNIRREESAKNQEQQNIKNSKSKI